MLGVGFLVGKLNLVGDFLVNWGGDGLVLVNGCCEC